MLSPTLAICLLRLSLMVNLVNTRPHIGQLLIVRMYDNESEECI